MSQQEPDDYSDTVEIEQVREVVVLKESDGLESLAEKESKRVIMRRDSMDEFEAATPNEVRDLLMEVVNNSREAHSRAMESHDLFVDLLANSGEENDIEKAKKDIMAALNAAQSCNKSMLSAVKLMLDSRRSSEGGVVQKGQIQNNFIFGDEHRTMNEMLKKRKDPDV